MPDLLAEFTPTAVMNVSFSGTDAQIGQPLTVAQVKETPSISIDGGANATDLAQGTYTIAMVDPATVGSDQSGGQVSAPSDPVGLRVPQVERRRWTSSEGSANSSEREDVPLSRACLPESWRPPLSVQS